MTLPFGYKEGDKLLNDSGVCTTYSETETIQIMKGWKHGNDHARLEIVTTPDGHYLIGLDVGFGNGGWGFAPSINGIGYDSREEAISAAVKRILGDTHIDSVKCRQIIHDNYIELMHKNDQLLLFDEEDL